MTPDASPDPRIEEASMWCLRLAEERLTTKEHEQLHAWLASDPRNAAAFEDVAHAWQAFEGRSTSPALVALRREALARFSHGQAGSRRPRAPWLRLAAAACLVLAIAGAALWLHLQPQRYLTGVGERHLVTLADGSQLSLDADTRVDVRYGRNRRELWLHQGRARFQVARDPLRPFSVSAGDRLVVATGTEFSVELIAREVHVVLYEGSVEVLAADRDARDAVPASHRNGRPPASATRAARLVPGREMVVRLDTAETQVREVDPVRARIWENGQVAFNDEALATVVERMNRYAGPRLSVADPATGALRISGTFIAGDNAAFAEGIGGIFPVRVRERDGGIVLSDARTRGEDAPSPPLQ